MILLAKRDAANVCCASIYSLLNTNIIQHNEPCLQWLRGWHLGGHPFCFAFRICKSHHLRMLSKLMCLGALGVVYGNAFKKNGPERRRSGPIKLWYELFTSATYYRIID